MRVLQPGGDLDFAEKAIVAERRCQLGMEDFDRDRSMVLEVLGEVDHRHAAAPELT